MPVRATTESTHKPLYRHQNPCTTPQQLRAVTAHIRLPELGAHFTAAKQTRRNLRQFPTADDQRWFSPEEPKPGRHPELQPPLLERNNLQYLFYKSTIHVY